MKSATKITLALGSALAAVIAFANTNSDKKTETASSCCPATVVAVSCCPAKPDGSACSKVEECGVLKEYVSLSDALAADDLVKAKEIAAALAKQAETEGIAKVVEAAQAGAKADALPAAREAFRTLSTHLVPMAKGSSSYVTMTCPMAKGDWLQVDNEVRNPYYGKSMLRCGGVKTDKSES